MVGNGSLSANIRPSFINLFISVSILPLLIVSVPSSSLFIKNVIFYFGPEITFRWLIFLFAFSISDS